MMLDRYEMTTRRRRRKDEEEQAEVSATHMIIFNDINMMNLFDDPIMTIEQSFPLTVYVIVLYPIYSFG